MKVLILFFHVEAIIWISKCTFRMSELQNVNINKENTNGWCQRAHEQEMTTGFAIFTSAAAYPQ